MAEKSLSSLLRSLIPEADQHQPLQKGKRRKVHDAERVLKQRDPVIPELGPNYNVIVKALAGTGKTFSMIVGAGNVFGEKIWGDIVKEIARKKNKDPGTFRVVPSQEQEAIWQAMRDIRDNNTIRTVVYCAFNKKIVVDFTEEWSWMCQWLDARCGVKLEFATINSLGYKVCRQAFGRGYLKCSDWAVINIISELTGMDYREARKQESKAAIFDASKKLASMVKVNLVGWDAETGFDVNAVTVSELDRLVSHYDIELNGCRDEVYDLVPKILRESLNGLNRGEITFDDQNWLPIVLGLPIPKVDLIMVDEGQDLNRLRQEFCLRMGRTMILVGDTNQAIYGFAGADVDSIPRMEELLGSPTILPLTETRRCAKAIVREAQQYVPEFRAHPDNPEGEIWSMPFCRPNGQDYNAVLEDGDMVLCRVNAPLVSQALRRLKEGKKAVIVGRSFGEQLLNFIKKLKATDVPDLIEKVDDWYHQECQKLAKMRNQDDSKVIAVEDRRDCIHAFCDGAMTVEEVMGRIDLVFTGKVCPHCGEHYDEEMTNCPKKSCEVETFLHANGKRYPQGATLVTPKGVYYSSIHKAKGAEADRVFLIRTKNAPLPHPMAKTAWAKQQEIHLIYVGITRGKNVFAWVTD
ncbi:MAG: UvrD-helicase domain-containing protein [bacterium]